MSITDTDTVGTVSASITDTDTGTGTNGTMTAGDTDTNGQVCPGTAPNTACETCLAENCCDAFTECENDVACVCALNCKNAVCLLGCDLNVLGLVNYLVGLGLLNGANDGCLLDQCGVLCPVAGLL